MPIKRKPRKRSSNTPLLFAVVVLILLCVCAVGGGVAAYSSGMFEQPLPTLAPTLTKSAAITPKATNTPSKVTSPTTASTTVAATPANTLPPSPTAKPITESVVRLDDTIEGLALTQDKAGTLHLFYNLLVKDVHQIKHYQKGIGGKWSGAITVTQGDVFVPLARIHPDNSLCLFWSGLGLFKACFINNTWTIPQKISNDLFPSSPVFAPDGAIHFLTSPNDTLYNGVDLDLPSTNTFDKFLVVDSSGRIHVVSKQLNDKGDIIHRISEDKGATWSSIAVITSGDELRALAADTQGRVHALFKNSYRVWSKDKGWSAPTSLNIDFEAGSTLLVIDSKGLAHVLARTRYLHQAPNGSWSPPIQIAAGDVLINASTSPQLWVDADGARHFAWAMKDNSILYSLLP
jgi:hypothetical protein